MTNWTSEELAKRLAENPDLHVEALFAANPTHVETAKGRKTKYGVAEKADRTYNGKVYHSKKEATFASGLDFEIENGEIDFYLEQVPFRLPGNIVYRLDFMAFKEVGKMITIGQNKDYFPYWKIDYFEVKGYKTRLGELKRKQTEALYHIGIDVV